MCYNPRMGKLLLMVAVIAAAVLFFKQCGPSQTKNAAFTGTWKIEMENGISGAKEEETVTVSADKDMFRTVAKNGGGSETVTVYDGEMLHQKYGYSAAPAQTTDAGAEAPQLVSSSSASPTRSEKKSVIQTGPLRFWSHSFVGQAGPGGKIADQDTVLYQAREKRPDGEITVQGWVDAKTGIVLKSVDTIYSSQVGSMVSKTTRECQEIRYGPVEPSTFAKP